MAGGAGSRFWPMSRNARPKQFLDILGVGRTFIQLTYDRFAKIVPVENILIVTSEQYADLIKEQLPDKMCIRDSVDVKVLKVTKSLIKVESDPIEVSKEGEKFEVELTCKGDGLSISIPDDAKSWLTVEAIILNGTKAVVKFNAAPNTGGARKTTLVFTTTSKGQVNTAETTVTQEGSILEMSIKDFLAQPESPTALYRLTGKVTNLAKSDYGNFDLVDATGKVYVYGLTATKVEKNDKSFPTLGIQEGDMVTLIGTRAAYKGTPPVSYTHLDVYKRQVLHSAVLL